MAEILLDDATLDRQQRLYVMDILSSSTAVLRAVDDPFDAPDAAVLLVDDNAVNLHVASVFLKPYGIACDTARSGREAFGKVTEKPYDIIFMDHIMPEMDGVTAARLLRERHAAHAPVIIAMTANDTAGIEKTFLTAGMDDYLSKPFEETRLRHVLLRWLPAEKIRRAPGREPLPEAKPELSSFLSRLETVGWLDVRLGLERTGGVHGTYAVSLGILARRLPAAIQKLTVFLEAGNMEAFSVEIHGLKGSLDTLGAVGMARDAEALEQRAKERDALFCAAHLPEFTEALATLHEKLAAALAENEPEPLREPVAKGDRDVLLDQIAMARDLLSSLEGDAALGIVRDLRRYAHSLETDVALRYLLERIEEFDYQGAIEIIDAL